MNIWLAPAHGLFLNTMCFDDYNKKIGIPELIEFNEKEEIRIKEIRQNIEADVMNEVDVNLIYKQWLTDAHEGKEIEEDDTEFTGENWLNSN